MTTPRQYTDTTDPSANPPEQAMQHEEYAPAGQHSDTAAQRADTAGQYGDTSAHRVDTAGQYGDTSAQQSVPPSGTTDRATAPESSTPARTHAESDRADGLFGEHDLADLRNRWNDVQAGFVDDPRDCVQRADGLVSSAVEQLTANFAQTRARLEDQWSRGEEASTEDLRVALKRYRDFFDRLLAV